MLSNYFLSQSLQTLSSAVEFSFFQDAIEEFEKIETEVGDNDRDQGGSLLDAELVFTWVISQHNQHIQVGTDHDLVENRYIVFKLFIIRLAYYDQDLESDRYA